MLNRNTKMESYYAQLKGRELGGIDTNHWRKVIPLPTGPIKYLEIGSLVGFSAMSINTTYAKDSKSEIHCVDPWIDYESYPEYKEKQNYHFTSFLHNMSVFPNPEKIRIHRDYSYNALSKFPNEYFDLILIDGNHEAFAVVEDAVHALRKVKKGGWIVFDNVEPEGWKTVVEGVELFMSGFKDFFSTYKHDWPFFFAQRNSN